MLNFQEWFELLSREISNTDSIQWAVLVFGVAEVLLARANNIWLYPTGIIATSLAIYGLFHVQLYAECVLHLYYIVMSIYGWWYWASKKGRPAVNVSFSTRFDWSITLAIVFGGWGLFYAILTTLPSSILTPTSVPAWDAWVSSTAWAGMWLLSRRKVENWILLNISNAFAIPLLFKKQLPLFALLTIFLFIVACKGYFDWIKEAKKRNMQTA
jgi:nicotinamide mononucleotide transporter